MKSNRRSAGVEMPCSKCGTKVKNVDSDTISVMCYRCVTKSASPNVIFLDEMDSETLERHKNIKK